jgi:Domain of unknown function DUF29
MPEQTLLPSPTITLYEQDFWLWTQTMAEALKSGNFSQLDLENLAEEVESLGRSDRRELQSRLTVLLMHLLKWQFQAEMRSGSWKGTLREQRRRIRAVLKDSPSLQSFLIDSIDDSYDNAREQAADETGLALMIFPVMCPYAIEDILNVEFLPEG